MRRLPPLTAIEAFVQVARLGSLKAAAEELALSSPALSRRVQAMERFCGRTLFDRRHQQLALNAEGDALLARLAPILDALGGAIDETRGDAEHLRLRLGVLPLWATQKLMPRLGELRERHPEFHIDIDTAPQALARLGESLDAAIVLARDIEPGLYSRRISRNRVRAIASRALAEGPGALTSPQEIARQTILVHRDMPDVFTSWRDAAGIPDIQPAAIDHIDSGALMLEAAARGHGIAFMLDLHLEEAHDERLASLFDQDVESTYGYWFACRRPALSRRSVRLFHDWVVETIAEG